MNELTMDLQTKRRFVQQKLIAGLGRLHLSKADRAVFRAIADGLSDEAAVFLADTRARFFYDFDSDLVAECRKFLALSRPSRLNVYLFFTILITALGFHATGAGIAPTAFHAMCVRFVSHMLPLPEPSDEDAAKVDTEIDWFRAWFTFEKTVKINVPTRDPELTELLSQSRRPFNEDAATWETEKSIFTLLHFSDSHASYRHLCDIMALADEYEGYFEDILNTGDNVLTHNNASVENYYKVPGIGRVLNTVGNHDALNNPFFLWDDMISEKAAAQEFIEPFVENWGVVREPETTYYYKIYEEQGILLLVLDSMLRGEDADREVAFAEKALSLALSAGLSVVIGVHDAPARIIKLPCNFSPLYTEPHPPCGPGMDRRIAAAVDRFKKAGGDFTVYLCGHYHDPAIVRDAEYPDQLYIIVGCLSPYHATRIGQSDRVPGTGSDSLANFVSFDIRTKTVKLVRYGVRYDCFLRSQKYLTFRYDTGELISFG